MGQDVSDCEGHFANYAEYSKTLRSWLVAYGIGGPALFLLGKDAPTKLSASPELKAIVTLFVIGVSLQIGIALINKWAAWHMYCGAYDRQLSIRGDPDCNNHHLSRTYAFWRCINRQSWVDFLVDLTTLLSFSRASWLVLKILLS